MNKYLLPLMVLFIVNNSFAHTQISNLITPVSYFINHEQQIKMLEKHLGKYRQASIVGTSGIGKTQLIRMYSYENKNNYDLIWLFDCNLDLNEQFVKLAQQLNMVKQTNISEAVTLAKKEVMSYLTSTSKWLLVFDNLKVNENKKVQNFIDWEHNGQVVFCSQNNERLPNVILMTLFDKPTIVTLANTLLDNKDKNSIEFLTQSFSGYPILIVQGIQLLNKIKGLDKEEYKKKIYQSTDKIATNISMAIKELKPSAVKLLNKIALINNQSFSKQLLAIITDNKNTLDDDIYQLSKFMLISNIDSNQDNPIFEMNDVVSNKIMEINGDKNNKICLEDIILKLPKLKGVHSAHVWRATKTISENLEIIFQNAEKYNINIYLMLNLRLQLFASYMNAWNLYKSKPMVNWFEQKEQDEQFKFWQMSTYQKFCYARYLVGVGLYNRITSINYQKTISYLTKALKVLDTLGDDYDYIYSKFNCSLNIALTHVYLGNIKTAEEIINEMEKLFKHRIEGGDIFILYHVKARIFFIQGKYNEALEYVNKGIEVWKTLDPNDLGFTRDYLLRAAILSSIGKYQEAYVQTQQVYNMHKSVNQEALGYIYTQMAKSELGLNKIDIALDHINKAITIFLADERRNPKNIDHLEDPDLAAGYVVQGDILLAQGNIKGSIESYKKAYAIYHYFYGDKSKNVVQVSELYNKGAKAACKNKDLYNYKFFGKPQIKEFGINHPNTIAMFEYCKQYDMDLWVKQD
ncbi:MAG: tetratricopeptide repeat protein [Rickettsiaceae bacterium]|nr:tetratricopeptide repeat protein [Rickettsiaceae bacterium]